MTSLIRYLATDNCMSLNALDTALEQLRAVDAAHATFLETIRTQTVASTAASLYEERLRTCELYSLYSGLGVTCPTCAGVEKGKRCTCPFLDPSAPVSSELLLEVINYSLRGCRRTHLNALRDGFQGTDQRASSCLDDSSVYDFSPALATLAPDEMALRLRGRAVGSADELALLLRFEPPNVNERKETRPVDAGVFSSMKAWFSALIRRFEPEQLALFLHFATAKRTLCGAPDPDKDAISVCIYADGKARAPVPLELLKLGTNAEPMTASTCSRRVYLPSRPGMDPKALEHLVRFSLESFAKENKLTTGGAAFGYE